MDLDQPDVESPIDIIKAALPPTVSIVRVHVREDTSGINVMGSMFPQYMTGMSTGMLEIYFCKKVDAFELRKCQKDSQSMIELALGDIPESIRRYITKHETQYADSSDHLLISFAMQVHGPYEPFLAQLKKEAWEKYEKVFDKDLEDTLTS